MSVLILACCLGQVPPLEGDPGLVRLIKDALATNHASLASGSLKGRIENTYTSDDGGDLVQRVQVEMTWSGTNTFWRMKLDDPTNTLLGRPTGFRFPGETPWEYLLRKDGTLHMYNAWANLAIIAREGTVMTRFLEVGPQDSWFRLGPDLGREGVYLATQVGLPEDLRGFEPSRYVISREPGDTIKQVRYDPDGSVMTMVFSIRDSCNPISMKYIGKGRVACEEGTYRWRKLPGGECVVVAWEFIHHRLDDPRRISAVCRFNVDEIKIGEVDESRFSGDTFLKMLPANTILNNWITKKDSRINVAANRRGLEESLEAFVPLLKRRGFLDDKR